MKHVNDMKVKISQNSEKLSHYELQQVTVEGDNTISIAEQREIEKTKKNVVLYRIPEIQSSDPEDGKAGDMLFLRMSYVMMFWA